MLRFHRQVCPLFLAITIAWSLLLALSGSTEAALFAAPVLLLAIPLAFGRYPGEELLAKLARPPRRPRAVRVIVARRVRAFFAAFSGGRLIAASIAERGPPAPALAR